MRKVNGDSRFKDDGRNNDLDVGKGGGYLETENDPPMRSDSQMIKLITGDDLKSSLGVGKDSDKTIIGQQPDGLGEETLKVSDLLKGNFSAVEIPYIEIPGSAPLVQNDIEEILEQIWEKDEFYTNELAEEYLMFTIEIDDKEVRKQDGPHQTLKWRSRVREMMRKEVQ